MARTNLSVTHEIVKEKKEIYHSVAVALHTVKVMSTVNDI
jgi:hypothetical protein